MKFKVWEPQDKEEEKEVYLRLVEGNDGGVVLRAVDREGNYTGSCDILHITSNGYLVRPFNCRVPGIQVDGNGMIKIGGRW